MTVNPVSPTHTHAPPQQVYADFDRAYTAEILNILTQGMIWLALLYVVTSVVLNNITSVWVGCGVLAVGALSNRACAWGYLRISSICLSGLLWIVFTLPALGSLTNGIYSVIFAAYLLPILIAGCTINGRAALLLAFASALVGLAIVLNDLTRRDDSYALLHWQALVLCYLMATVLVALYRRRSLNFLRRLRANERRLIDQNTRLQAEIDSRREAEKSLSERGERLTLALQIAQMDTFMMELKSGVIHYPDASPDYIPPYRTYDAYIAHVHPDDRPRVEAAVEKCVAQGDSLNVEYRIIREDGRTEWYISLGGLIRDSRGEPFGINGIVQEITRHKMIEERLRNSETAAHDFQEQLKILIEVSTQLATASSVDEVYHQAVRLGLERLGFDRLAIWLIDHKSEDLICTYGTDDEGRIIDERGKRLVSTNAGELKEEIVTGKAQVLTMRDMPLYYNGVQLGTGWNALSAIWREDKIDGWLAADNLLRQEPLTHERIQLLALYGTILGHLLLEKRTQDRLQRNEERLQMALQAARMRTWEWHPSNDFIRSYDRHHVGWEVGTIKLSDYLTYLHPDDRERVHQIMQDAVKTNNPAQWDYRNQQKDGSYRWVGVISQPITENGEGVGLVGVAYDISERKDAESKALELALQEERIAMMRDFMSSITHDLKTPLSVIRTSLYLLEKIHDDDNKRKSRMDLIEKQIDFLDNSLQDILTISRLDYAPAPGRAAVDLVPMLNAVQTQLIHKVETKGLALNLNVEADLPTVNGDADELMRVITNLVENAINYTAQGSVSVGAHRCDEQVCIEVSDTGIGIDEADVARIFNRFYRTDTARRTHDGGTGLGLAIVQRIVEMHNGTIEVNSQAGVGSTFRVLLPIFERE